MNGLFSHITGDPKTDVTDDNIRSLMFGDYLSKGKDERLYDEIQNLEELRQVGEILATSTDEILGTSFELFRKIVLKHRLK